MQNKRNLKNGGAALAAVLMLSPLVVLAAKSSLSTTATCKAKRCVVLLPTPTPSPTPAPSPTPTPTPTPASTGSTLAAVYDTSVGTGVDAAGFANLPLRSGAHRFFVSSATGGDSVSCANAQQPSTPLRSLAAAAACVTRSAGDQILVAEGSVLAAGLPTLNYKGGFSAAYPTVIQSYDPADPFNEARYGRATANRPNVFSAGGSNQPTFAGDGDSYFAFRGLKFDPGNTPDNGVSFTGPNSYVLFENNVFAYTGLGFNHFQAGGQPGLVIRHNAFYGQWSPTAHSQGLYAGTASTHTVEDNVFWHTGWKIGASRSDTPANGGATMFRHSVYSPVDTDVTFRRNVVIDPAATGLSARGNTTAYENVFIDNPIGIAAATEDYNMSYRPSGIDIDIHDNAFLGDADIDPTNPRGMAIFTANGKPTATVRHNLILRSRNMAGTNVYAFWNQALPANGSNPAMISNMTYEANLIYRWDGSGNYLGVDPANTGNLHASFNNNRWDAPSSGSNTNNATASFPSPLTSSQLFSLLACTDKPTCAAAMVQAPQNTWAANSRSILWNGYFGL